MSEKQKYTLLGNAEAYQTEVDRGRGPSDPKYRSWDESRSILKSQFSSVALEADKLPPVQRLDEVVLELKLSPKYLAKSYHPLSLFRAADFTLRGSDSWRKSESPDDVGRVLYVSTTPERIRRTLRLFDHASVQESLERDFAKVESVRLPDASARVPELDDASEPHAIELVLFGWDARQRDEAVRRIRDLLLRAKADPKKILVRPYQNGPTFVAAVVQSAVLTLFRELNFVRMAGALPRVEVTRMALTKPSAGPTAIPQSATSNEYIAVFDGGVDTSIPAIAPFVWTKDCTTKPPDPGLVAHGTAVISAALYGSLQPGGVLQPPPARVASFRVLPDALDSNLELYGVIDSLEDWVPKLGRNVRVINLSLGPPGPIGAKISRFTYAIDKLAFQTGKLFVTAAGNWGEKPDPAMRRIQAPADGVNALAVGAFSYEPKTRQYTVAPYSCVGPGRSGAVVKPDVHGFGGSKTDPFYILEAPGHIVGNQGTSLACPVVSRTAVDIVGRCASMDALSARAAMIHKGVRPRGIEVGHGIVHGVAEDMVACTSKSVSVLYQGVLSPKKTYRLPFLLPPSFSAGGGMEFTWTIVYLPDVDANAHDEYCVCGLEVQFRPDKMIFSWTAPKPAFGDRPAPRELHLTRDKVEIATLEAAGWHRGNLPASDTASKTTEHHRRQHDSKWETTLCSRKGRRKDVDDPAITVSVIPRGHWDDDDSVQARYAAILTTSVPKYSGDLYAEVLQHARLLQPVTVSTPTQIQT